MKNDRLSVALNAWPTRAPPKLVATPWLLAIWSPMPSPPAALQVRLSLPQVKKIDDAGREFSTASAPVVRGDREDHFLRMGQVLDAAGQEGLGHGDRVQRLPHPLDQAVLGHETGSKQVMEGAPGRLRRRVGHVFGEHLPRGIDQDVDVLGPEGQVQIEP